MALGFKSPQPRHNYNVSKEKSAITRHFKKRNVPKSSKGKLLLTSWNIANLGAQDRTPNARTLIAHILKRFDLIAVQEVNDKFRDFVEVVDNMGSAFDYIMTDTAGNNERLAFIYRINKVFPTNLNGELALRPREYPKRTVKVRYKGSDKKEHIDTFKNLKFEPFDRNPYICSFNAGKLDITLVNVHLYFGKFQDSKKKADRKKYARRVLEIFALSRWADRRFNKPSTYNKNILLLGDMNVPVMDKKDSAFKALKKFGWQEVDYVTRTGGSNLGNNKTYDQMLFAPGTIGKKINDFGVFDFDKAAFKSLWEKLENELSHTRAVGLFNRHMKHHLSDHRPLWIELDIS